MIGLSIGVILVYFMFGNRGCAWLPENRVKNMIGEKEIIIGDSILDIMQTLELTNDDIYNLLKDKGDVDFSLSDTQEDPKVYYFSAEKGEITYSARFALYEEPDISEVISLSKNGKLIESSRSNKNKSTLPLPRLDVMAIIESHEFRTLEKAQCQQKFYGLTDDEVSNFHTTAAINISASEPRLSPNPYYVLDGMINNQMYSITYVIGENRTRISNIKGQKESNCKVVP